MEKFNFCGDTTHNDLFQHYPVEATTPFEPNPEMDEHGKQEDISFSKSLVVSLSKLVSDA